MAIRVNRPLMLAILAAVPRGVDFSLRFGRTIILSHLLSQSEFGLCLAFAVVLTIEQLAGDIGFDRFLMSRLPGQEDDALAAAHALQIARGLLFSALTVLAAPWIAEALGAAGQAASFRWCGAIIFVEALGHLEIRQAQRDLRYLPEASAVLTARILAFAVVYPAAVGFGDHRAMIASLLTDTVVYVASSHVLARVPYRVAIRWRPAHASALRYGLPLTVNGVGIATGSQLDRAVVSHGLGLEALAGYAVILNLALVPLSLLASILGLLGLTFIVRMLAERAGPEAYATLVWGYATAAAAYAVFVAATVDMLVPLVFGKVYAVPRTIHLLVTAMAWLRLNRGAPTAALLGTGRTWRLTAANLSAGCGIVLALVLLPVAPRTETVLVSMLIGDAICLAAFMRATAGAFQRSAAGIGATLCWSFAAVAVAGLGIPLFAQQVLWLRAAIAGFALAIVAAQFALGLQQHVFRGPVREFLGGARAGGASG